MKVTNDDNFYQFEDIISMKQIFLHLLKHEIELKLFWSFCEYVWMILVWKKNTGTNLWDLVAFGWYDTRMKSYYRNELQIFLNSL